jgi:2-methylisocitrate lyase-like PEP mutase family enzyme
MRVTARLRRLLDRDQPLVAPGAYDAVSAKLVERAGFEAVYLTGFGTVASAYGLPDLGLATMTEMAEHAARVATGVSIPVLADADAGYGNALSVKRTVRAYEQSGVAGLHLEDQVSPKKCGHMAGKQVIPLDEMCGKLRAALDARQDPDFVIIARTDAIAPEGFEAAIARARAYLAVGADLAFVEAPATQDQLRQIPQRVGGPCLFNAVLSERGALAPLADLAAVGYRLVIVPTATLWAAAAAVAATLAELRQHGDLARLEQPMMSFREFVELMGAPALEAEASRYG